VTAPGGGGLEDRIRELEAAVRSLMATNWTDRASVVDAAGNAVPLSALAFGQVAANTNAQVTVQGVIGGYGQVTSTDHTPQVVVYVSGGRLRVDVAGQLYSALDASASTAGYNAAVMTPWCRGPYPNAAAATAGLLPTGVTTRSSNNPVLLEVDKNGTGTQTGALGAGNFSLFTNLPPGFYLVGVDYMLDYDSTGQVGGNVPSVGIRRRSVSAQPY
jgi:hypothetical protein